jgi:hypothetical protein
VHLVTYLLLVSIVNIDHLNNGLNPVSDTEALKRPSEYLRKRCPLCFGGVKRDWNEM